MLRKELRSELRSKSGLMTSALFGVVTVVTISLATFSTKLNGDVAAGLLWVAILFTALIALPRTFLVEEDQGTGDLLRLVARPHAVFWGKAFYNLILITVAGFMLAGLFLMFAGREVRHPLLLVVSLFGGCASLAGAVTLSGALVARAANRAALAAAVSAPLLLSVLAIGVSTVRVALDGALLSGWPMAFGSICYAVVLFAIGPWLFAAVWKS